MTTPNDGFILREDAALKAYLQGIKVHDASSPVGGRAVPVYFRLPEQEARARNYPYITIDLLAITRDPSREHRGTFYFGEENEYFAQDRQLGDISSVDWPIPMLFTYQVTSFARFIQHDRQITTALLTNQLVVRFGALPMVAGDGFTDDNSMRRLEYISGPINADSPDPADPNKRIFRKAHTVEMSSEMFLAEIQNLNDVVGPDVIITLDPNYTASS